MLGFNINRVFRTVRFNEIVKGNVVYTLQIITGMDEPSPVTTITTDEILRPLVQSGTVSADYYNQDKVAYRSLLEVASISGLRRYC